MNLNVQLKTIAFSFLLGIFIYLSRIILYKALYNSNKTIKYISSFIYVEIVTFIYIKCSYIINNLNIHFYSLFFLVLGYFITLFIVQPKNM